MSSKHILVCVAATLVVLAVVNRIPKARELLNG
jgi:hypothetical protein